MKKYTVSRLPHWVLTDVQPAFYDTEAKTVLQQSATIYKKMQELIESYASFTDDIESDVTPVLEFFDNLDVQEEINNKLDQMVQDGTLEVSFQKYVTPLIQDTNDRLTIIQNDVSSIKNAYGAPLIASSSAGMTDHNRIYVYVGTTGGGLTNGHWYYWSGEAWSDGGVYQSAGIGTGAISRNNLNSWFASELDKDSYKAIGENTGNLIWTEDLWNGYFQYSGGAGGGALRFYSSNSYKSVILRVTAGVTYHIKKLTHYYYTADSNFNQISAGGSSGADATNVEITIPENATYLIVDFKVANDIKDVCVSTSTNYTLPNRYVLGKYLAQSEYTYVMTSGGYIEVTDENILKFPTGFIIVHGQSRGFTPRDIELDTTLSEGVNVVMCNVDTGATRVIGWKNLNPDNFWSGIADKTNPREFILAIYYAPYLWISGNRIDISQYVHKPLHIAFMGDSITAGNNCTKAYHMYLHDVTRQHCHNYGCGGTGFVVTTTANTGKVGGGMEGVPSSASQQSGNNTIGQIIDTVPESFTNFVVCAGTNDYGGNVSMSNFSNAVQGVIDKLYERGATFMFMTPIRRNSNNRDGETPNTQGLKLSDYVNKIIELCDANGVRYVDMYNNTSLNPNNTYNKSTYVPDGLHPNNAGQKLMAEKVVDTFKSLFTDFK